MKKKLTAEEINNAVKILRKHSCDCFFYVPVEKQWYLAKKYNIRRLRRK